MAIKLWERVKNFMRQILIPANTVYKSFGADPPITDQQERALTLWYELYTGSPPWAGDEVKPLGLPSAIAKEFAQVVSSEMAVTLDGGPRADYLSEQVERNLPGLQARLPLGIALGGLAIKPYVSGGRIFLDATGATGFTPLRFDDGGICVSGVFRSQPVKVDRAYYVRLEYHDLTENVYTIKNKAFRSDEHGLCGTEVTLYTVPNWAHIQPEVEIQNVERPLFGYFTAGSSPDFSGLGASVYAGETVELIRQADEQWERFLYEFQSAERKIIATAEAVSGPIPGGGPNPLERDRLYVAMPYDSDEFFKEFSPALRSTGFYEGLQAILRRIEFNVGLAYGDLSDPSTVEKTATEVLSAKTRKYNTVRAMEKSLAAALENAVYGMDVYATLYGLAPRGEYTLYVDFEDSILTDADAQRERDRQDVRDGFMQKWEYRVKWYHEDEETAKAMCPPTADTGPGVGL